MSLLGELNLFLGLQIIQSNKGIIIHQTKYVKEILKKFQFEDCKPIDTPMIVGCKLTKKMTPKTLIKEPTGQLFGACYMLQLIDLM